MIKTKIALAAVLACFALAPASAVAAKPAKSKAKSTKVVKKSTKAKKAVVGAAAIGATAAAASKSASASDNAAPARASEGRLDRRMSTLSMQYLTALWRVDPEGGIYVGKFDQAANLTLPDPATRASNPSSSARASAVVSSSLLSAIRRALRCGETWGCRGLRQRLEQYGLHE